ncbi:MAG: MgtC/SapB family protein [Candidatus Aenigmarchaeota archaeon]|nr:MgtC/SapB family protein [Candidatus Aenigmarchaeota archaeon]
MVALETGILIKLLISTLLGMLIGLERGVHKKPAGLRTHSLVALGSCLFTLAALGLGDTEVSKLLPGIVTGIGFLGAGSIFQSKNKVKGMTTAAEIWTLAAIGVLVGLGEYYIAIASTILILIILVPFKWFEKSIEK